MIAAFAYWTIYAGLVFTATPRLARMLDRRSMH
jgi:hypothetical protein